MEQIYTTTKIVFSVVGGFIVNLIGGYDPLISLWLFLVVTDVVTGVIKYVMKKELSSMDMFTSLLKKVIEYIVIALAVKLEGVFGNAIPIREITIFFYITNEFISVLENCADFLPIPDQLTDYFKQLDNKPTIEEEKKQKEIEEDKTESFDSGKDGKR